MFSNQEYNGSHYAEREANPKSVAKVVPGQVVQAQDLLFQIVDPKGLWVEALAYGDLDVGSVAGASALAANGQNMLLKYEGLSGRRSCLPCWTSRGAISR